MFIMKYLKIVLIVLAVSLALSSCDKTPAFEGQATVGFKSDTLNFSYGSDIYDIPVVFEGTSNVFPIVLDIEIAPDYDGDRDEYLAVEDKDYYLTSTDLSFGRPDDYDELIEENTYVTITKNLEVRYPETNKDELRFKLRINSVSVEGVQITTDECVVIISKPVADRLAGTYTITGELFERISHEETVPGSDGKDSTIVVFDEYRSLGNASYTVELLTETNGVSVNNLFSTESQIEKGEFTSFTLYLSDEPRTLSMPLGPENSAYLWQMNVGIQVVDDSDNFVEGPVNAYYDSNYSSIVFDDIVTDNYLTFAMYSGAGNFISYYREDTFLKVASFTRN